MGIAIELRVRRAAARAGNLPEAILSKAFAGEPVPTEAGLAGATGRDYESAEQLLLRARTASSNSDASAQPRSTV